MLSLTANNLCISGYNSTGFGLSAQNYIGTLLSFSDICCIQEHFLQDCNDKKTSNTDKLRKQFGGRHDMFIVPAKKNNSQVSRGRAKGGLATIWNKIALKVFVVVGCGGGGGVGSTALCGHTNFVLG